MQEFIDKLIGRLERKAEQACVLGDVDAWYDGKETGFLEAIEIIKELAEQHSNGWIPCDKQLPDDTEDEEYIVCVNGTDGNITYDHAVLAGFNFFEDGKWYIDGMYKENVEVLAWMRFPEPYIKPKSELKWKDKFLGRFEKVD